MPPQMIKSKSTLNPSQIPSKTPIRKPAARVAPRTQPKLSVHVKQNLDKANENPSQPEIRSQADPSKEYAHFAYSRKLAPTLQPETIRLLTKIYNIDNTNQQLLSLVVVTDDDQVYGYGHNAHGCLGVAVNANTFVGKASSTLVKKPTLIKSLCNRGLLKLSSGNCFVVALTASGQCYSWGSNKFGQLGLDKTVVAVPKPVWIKSMSGETIVDIACGMFHVLLLTSTYDLYAFGCNVSGAIGNGTNFNQTKPCKLTNLMDDNGGMITTTSLMNDVCFISCGGWHSACTNLKGIQRMVNVVARLRQSLFAGDLYVWGWNQNSQCCCEDTKTNQLLPKKILLPSTSENLIYSPVQSVQCGLHHTLVLTFDSKVYAFGSNQFGECAQDPALVQICSQATLVDQLDEPIVRIAATSKNRLSLAASTMNIYIWGQYSSLCKGGPQWSYTPTKIAFSQQLNYGYSFNYAVAKNDGFEFNLDRDLCSGGVDKTKHKLLIVCQPQTVASHQIGETFNSPLESDTVIIVEPKLAKKAMMIFVQETILDGLSTFMQTHQDPVIDAADAPLNDSPVDDSNQVNSISLNKIKYHRISVNDVSFETLYSYLFAIYSGQLIVNSSRLIEMFNYAHSENNERVCQAILDHVRSDFDIVQLCSLYPSAVQMNLHALQMVCVEQIKMLARQVGPEYFKLTLYAQRNTNGQVTLVCSEGTQQVHLLVLHAFSKFYSTLSSFDVTNLESSCLLSPPSSELDAFTSTNAYNSENTFRNNFIPKLLSLNKVTSLNELDRLEQIDFGSLLSGEVLETFVDFVYCSLNQVDYPLLHDSINVLVNLHSFVNLLQETELTALCQRKLIAKIESSNNVCQYFIELGVDQRNEFIANYCIQYALADLERFLLSDDYRRLLVNSKYLSIFMTKLVEGLKRKTVDRESL